MGSLYIIMVLRLAFNFQSSCLYSSSPPPSGITIPGSNFKISFILFNSLEELENGNVMMFIVPDLIAF